MSKFGARGLLPSCGADWRGFPNRDGGGRVAKSSSQVTEFCHLHRRRKLLCTPSLEPAGIDSDMHDAVVLPQSTEAERLARECIDAFASRAKQARTDEAPGHRYTGGRALRVATQGRDQCGWCLTFGGRRCLACQAGPEEDQRAWQAVLSAPATGGISRKTGTRRHAHRESRNTAQSAPHASRRLPEVCPAGDRCLPCHRGQIRNLTPR